MGDKQPSESSAAVTSLNNVDDDLDFEEDEAVVTANEIVDDALKSNPEIIPEVIAAFEAEDFSQAFSSIVGKVKRKRDIEDTNSINRGRFETDDKSSSSSSISPSSSSSISPSSSSNSASSSSSNSASISSSISSSSNNSINRLSDIRAQISLRRGIEDRLIKRALDELDALQTNLSKKHCTNQAEIVGDPVVDAGQGVGDQVIGDQDIGDPVIGDPVVDAGNEIVGDQVVGNVVADANVDAGNEVADANIDAGNVVAEADNSVDDTFGGGIMKGGYSEEEYQKIINNMYMFILLRNVTFVTRQLTERENKISEIYIDPNTKAQLLYYKLKQKIASLDPPLKDNIYYTVSEIGADGVWKFSKLQPEGSKKLRALSLPNIDDNGDVEENEPTNRKGTSSPLQDFLSAPSPSTTPRGTAMNFITKPPSPRSNSGITTGNFGGYKKTYRNGNKNKNKSRKVRKTKRQTKNSKAKTKKHKKIIKHKKTRNNN